MLTKVTDIQNREGLTDGDMAARLGISRWMWNRIRNGHKPFDDKLAVRAAGVWPELTRDLLDRASASVSVVPERTNATPARRRSVLQNDTVSS